VNLAGDWAGDRVMPAFQDLWPRWRQAVVETAYRGLLCFGPNKGRRVTYTNPRRWLPRFKPASEDEAIGTVIARYLYAYGQATPQQFAQWIGAPAAWAAEQYERHSRKLTKINFDGTPAWVANGDTEMPDKQDTKGSILLLPYFDAYAVGSHPRSRLFPGRAATCALARPRARPGTTRSCSSTA
jgi:hypothetical protein